MSSREPIGIKLDANCMTAFQQALRYEHTNLNNTAEEVLRWGAYYFARSARKATKKARKNAKRKVFPMYDSGTKGREKSTSKRWGVLLLSQKRGPKRVRMAGSQGMTKTEAKRIPLAAVPNVGAAKNSWYGALKKVNKGMTENSKVGDASNVEYMRSSMLHSMTITNKLAYLLKVQPELESIGLANAAKGIALRVERQIGKKW
jgi:hypothetical protein